MDLYVGSIYPYYGPKRILKYFSQFGKIKELRLVSNERVFYNEGFARVSYQQPISTSVLQKNHFLKEKQIEVREYQDDENKFTMKCYRRAGKIFVGGLSAEANE